MPVRTPSISRLAAVVVAIAVPFAARAADGFHPLDSALEFMDLKAAPGAMPGFVEDARPAAPADDYIPVGTPQPTRALKPKTPAEVKAATAALDAARAAQLAGKRPKPAGTPAAAKPLDLAPRPKLATDR